MAALEGGLMKFLFLALMREEGAMVDFEIAVAHAASLWFIPHGRPRSW